MVEVGNWSKGGDAKDCCGVVLGRTCVAGCSAGKFVDTVVGVGVAGVVGSCISVLGVADCCAGVVA